MFIAAFNNSPILHISDHYSGIANVTVLQTMTAQPKYLQNKY